LLTTLVFAQSTAAEPARQTVRLLYLPIADHYAALLAHGRYRGRFVHAEFVVERMDDPSLLRARFREPDVDLALQFAPLALEMYLRNPEFRWIGLAHRDGGALVANERLAASMSLAPLLADRKPSAAIAEALAAPARTGMTVNVSVAHPLVTQTVVLDTFLREHGRTLRVLSVPGRDVALTRQPPASMLAHLAREQARGDRVATLHSLPWPFIAEQAGLGRIVWFSRDVMRQPGGFVDCLALAKNDALAHKEDALREVMAAFLQAAADIEVARHAGGSTLDELAQTLRAYIPQHPEAAIRETLRTDPEVIHFRDLGIDRDGLRIIMQDAQQAGILATPVDIDAFADPRFDAPASVGVEP
jgi:NitT/TauT family transport system substrate-binding protein